jgi:hypothetical protein
MRRLRLAFAAGALLAVAAFGLLLRGREPVSPRRVTSLPTAERAPEPLPVPAEAPTAAAPEPRSAPEEPRVAPVAPLPGSPPAARDTPRASAEIAALEERALRRIDVVPLLESSGVDVAALRRRPDADEVMRHVAGDELLTRMYMRQMFSVAVYPPEVPRETALANARSVAEDLVSRLGADERAGLLAHELAQPEAPPPEPVFSAGH